jgi:hypothetical protein
LTSLPPTLKHAFWEILSDVEGILCAADAAQREFAGSTLSTSGGSLMFWQDHDHRQTIYSRPSISGRKTTRVKLQLIL